MMNRGIGNFIFMVLSQRVISELAVRSGTSVESARATNAGIFDTAFARTLQTSNLLFPALQGAQSVQHVSVHKRDTPKTTPAVSDGVYCRGFACFSRAARPNSSAVLPVSRAEVLANQEFCHGLSCINGMGWPFDPVAEKFKLGCTSLFNSSGLLGDLMPRTAADVHKAFLELCPKRVGPLEIALCKANYSDVISMALDPVRDQPSLGGISEICTSLLDFIKMVKVAEIDLELTLPESHPHIPLSVKRNRQTVVTFLDQAPQDKFWSDWVHSHSLYDIGIQCPQDVGCSLAPTFAHGGSHEIVPASLDGPTPRVVVDSNRFKRCMKKMDGIVGGACSLRPPSVIEMMMRDWCQILSAMSSFSKDMTGRPDWEHYNCKGIGKLAQFALRKVEQNSCVSSEQVCRNLFLAVAFVHRVDRLVVDGSARDQHRNLMSTFTMPSENDSEMRHLMEEKRNHMERVMARLRDQSSYL